ncbi:helix-turn-helix transcriptional regulator [Kribbella sp. NPDC056345]|uniref:helix-turn-helix transcriptional regulator n=1 Tax=Kribbella sp. NPDC056345 TaxID=3345789 RepID=UPI0035D8D513
MRDARWQCPVTYERTRDDERNAETYRLEFCRLLRAERKTAGLSLRQLGELTGHSHPYIFRVMSGRNVPHLPVVLKILDACGVDERRLGVWRDLWHIVKAGASDINHDGVALKPGRAPWRAVAYAWHGQVDRLRDADPLLGKIRATRSVDQLGLLLTTVTQRGGKRSLRQLEDLSGIPRATLHGWCTGRRAPSAVRLDQLLVALGATRTERFAFSECLRRINSESSSRRYNGPSLEPLKARRVTGGNRPKIQSGQ